jgi:hypothetical protein
VSFDALAMLAPTIPVTPLPLFDDVRGTIADMKIATFNVNGVNGRLPVLLRWLNDTSQRRDRAEEVRLLTEGITPAAAFDRSHGGSGIVRAFSCCRDRP